MGYYDDQAGILRRYRRETQNWDAHLQHTRQFVIDAAQGMNRQSAIVLGSGWLLDVPLQELSAMFAQVTLADIRHPAKIKQTAEKLGNVECKACDISGFALPVYRYVQQYRRSKKRPPLDCIVPDVMPDWSKYDFVFSCNILSQLDILLVDYLSQFFELDGNELTAFRQKVQQTHIDSLSPTPSCLVADYEERTYSPDGQLLNTKPLIDHPITAKKYVHWTWTFDTKMTYYAGKNTSFEVLAVHDLR
jgi:hypothetical protein